MHEENFLPDVLHACSTLQISPEGLTKKSVTDAWKHEILKLDEREGETGVFARRKPRDGSGGDALLPPMEE